MRLLIAKGVDLDCRNNGITALHEAVIHKFYDAIEVLLDEGADDTLSDSSGMAPLHIAAQGIDEAALQPFIRSRVRLERNSMIDNTARKCSNINITDHMGFTPLYYAVRDRQEGKVRLILDAGADVQYKARNWGTALHEAIRKKSVVIARILLDYGAHASATNGEANDERETPLHYAIVYCDSDNDMIQLLLERGSDVHAARAFDGQTPLHLVFDSDYRRHKPDAEVEVVIMLLKHGAPVSATDVNNQTPLHRAIQQGTDRSLYHILEYTKQTPTLALDVQRLSDGVTALHLAIKCENVGKAQMLLDCGASFMTCSIPQGTTALDDALSSPLESIKELGRGYVRFLEAAQAIASKSSTESTTQRSETTSRSYTLNPSLTVAPSTQQPFEVSDFSELYRDSIPYFGQWSYRWMDCSEIDPLDSI